MLSVEISEETFARLQRNATPLVDTIETVINRSLDALEGTSQQPRRNDSASSYNPASPPSLSFTTVRSVLIDNDLLPPEETFWNGALLYLVRKAGNLGLQPKQISEITLVRNTIGKNLNNGFKYIKEAGISVQGQDANTAWRGIFHLATELKSNVEVAFFWQNNPKAAFPGQKAQLTILN